MASRLRLFVKKRGSRRTGTRWAGMVVEAVISSILVLLGLLGLWWLVDRALWSAPSDGGGWLWAAMLIPTSLVAYGTSNLWQLFWNNAVSTGRRAAVVQKAADWELPGAPTATGRPTLPAVPPIDAVIDSP